MCRLCCIRHKRHTYSTLLRHLKVDIKVQQALLRHAHVRTTLNVYTHEVSSDLREANDKLLDWFYRKVRRDSAVQLRSRPKCPLKGKGLWGGRWELNPQRPEPQSGALPVELLPPRFSDYSKFRPYFRITGRA